ncbi:MAG: hypothetical protein C0404_07335 [Verrucomicrobia bacterium]|nr:hypothetical protein [Verrucomicrobiota bacterium]
MRKDKRLVECWRPILAALVAILPCLASAEMGADAVIAKSGISGGLCAFPRAAAVDENLALELARRHAFVVHMMSQNDKLVSGLRDVAESSGVLGRTLYVEKGPGANAGGRLPFADRLVDLMVATDLRDADLTPELRAEWLRVLAPRRGTAVVGRSKAAGTGLSEAALKAWIKDLPLSKVVSDESGVWALLKVDLPAGSDSWTHRCHGADNTQVSADTTFKAPFLTQWWDGPGREGFWGTTVLSANGRMIIVRSPRGGGGVNMTVRSLTSGLVLWEKALGVGYISARPCAALGGDTLYLVQSNAVVRLDAETGAETGRIMGPKADGQIKWMALVDGTLAMLAGEPDKIRFGDDQVISSNSIGRELAVYDLRSGNQLWQNTLAGDLDQRMIAVRGGRLYCLVSDVGLVARELLTGKVAWTDPAKDIQAQFLGAEKKMKWDMFQAQPTIMAFDDVLVLRTMWAKEMFVVSAKDGSVLWRKPAAPMAGAYWRTMAAVASGGLWVSEKGCFDLKTGASSSGPKYISSGCAFTTATPNYLIAGFGSILDIKANQLIRLDDMKATCDAGTIVSEGIVASVPAQCGCAFELNCYRALASAGGLKPHTAPPWKDRLTVLDAKEPAAMVVDDMDWPTYRHDPKRTGATAALVGKDAKLLWHWKPAGCSTSSVAGRVPHVPVPRNARELVPTAPVMAAGMVWFASGDGMIRCLKADSGKEAWKYPTGARVYASPTVWQGRLFVGGGDGVVYCLDALTGRCLWKLMAAPAERRIFRFGSLVNTWPILSGVVIQDGVGYTIAGNQQGNGVHVYAFDPKTGAVIWEKDDAGGVNGELSKALSINGVMAIGYGKMWTCGLPVGCFDLKTGDFKAMYRSISNHAAVFDEQWMIHGGFKSASLNHMTSVFNGCHLMPAWDAELMAVPPAHGGTSVDALEMPKLRKWMEGEDIAYKTGKAPAGHTFLNKLSLWRSKSTLATAVALTKDQIVVPAIGEYMKPHTLSGYLRTDGSTVWTMELPEKPVEHCMAIDRTGRVLVGLGDGSILCAGR